VGREELVAQYGREELVAQYGSCAFMAKRQ
jgi:hypothetical protein